MGKHPKKCARWESGLSARSPPRIKINVEFVNQHLSFSGHIDREEWIKQAKDEASKKMAAKVSSDVGFAEVGRTARKKVAREKVAGTKTSVPAARRTTETVAES